MLNKRRMNTEWNAKWAPIRHRMIADWAQAERRMSAECARNEYTIDRQWAQECRWLNVDPMQNEHKTHAERAQEECILIADWTPLCSLSAFILHWIRVHSATLLRSLCVNYVLNTVFIQSAFGAHSALSLHSIGAHSTSNWRSFGDHSAL